MTTKTISVDIEAYERLRSVRKENESFSQTIKRVIRGPIDFDQWLKSIEETPLSDEAVEAVEQSVARRRNPHRTRGAGGGAGKGGGTRNTRNGGPRNRGR